MSFRDFVVSRTGIDTAIGFAVGAAFGTVISTIVQSVITPVLSFITNSGNLDTYQAHLHGVPIPYGKLIVATLTFALTLIVIYFLVVTPVERAITRLAKEDPQLPCPHCASKISIKAARCPVCTSWLVPKDQRGDA